MRSFIHNMLDRPNAAMCGMLRSLVKESEEQWILLASPLSGCRCRGPEVQRLKVRDACFCTWSLAHPRIKACAVYGCRR